MSLLGEKIFIERKLETQRKISKNLIDILNDEIISKKSDLSLEEIREFRKDYEYNYNSAFFLE